MIFLTCRLLRRSTLRGGTHSGFHYRILLRGAPQRNLWSSLSRNKSAAELVKESSKVVGSGVKKAYSDRLLFYYAGRKTVYLGTLKLYTVLLFSYCALIVAPSVGLDTEYGALAPIGAVIAGAIPLAFVQYLSPPYVTHAYLKIPAFARYSREQLLRYARSLPKDAEIELATIRFLGRPRLATVKAGELRPTRKRLGCVNFEWKAAGAKKPGLFYIDPKGSSAKVAEPEVFKEVMEALRKHAAGSDVKRYPTKIVGADAGSKSMR